MRTHRTAKRLGVLAVLAVCLTRPATPCAYHGLIGDGFSAMHARSLEVAVALREAIDAGLLAEHPVMTKRVDLVGFHRAEKRLAKLRGELQRLHAGGQSFPGFSLLLIEPALWSRFKPKGQEIRLEVESGAPAAGEATVITGEGVIAAIAAGRLTGSEAVARRLLVVDAPPADSEHLIALLMAALTRMQPPA